MKKYLTKTTIKSWHLRYASFKLLKTVRLLCLAWIPNLLRLPDLKIVITGTQYGYKREDGVYVIPLGCLKD